MMATKKKASAAPPPKLLKTDPNLSKAEKDAIEAHAAWKNAEKVLNVFIMEHQDVFDTYHQLIEEHNQKWQVADHAIRATDKSFAEWRRSERTKYNPEALYSLVGKAKFLAFGGKISSRSVYEIDDENIELAIAKGELEEDESFKKVTPAYTAPKQK